jgi:hypothetical protein
VLSYARYDIAIHVTQHNTSSSIRVYSVVVNRQLEAPPSRAAGIEVEDAADRFDLRCVGMPGDDHVDAGAKIGLQRFRSCRI